MKKYLLLLAIITASCSAPKLKKDILNLEKFNLDFNVEAFYADDESSDDQNEGHLLENVMKAFGVNSIRIDSAFVNEFSYDQEKELVGIQYNMTAWSPRDSLVYFHNMKFAKINMMQNIDRDFMALVASNESDEIESFDQLLAYLTAKNGAPEIIEEDFFGPYTLYSWELEDRLIAISSKVDNKENTLKIGIEVDQNGVEFDTEKKPSINTQLFILKKKHIEAVRGKLSSGDWLYLK